LAINAPLRLKYLAAPKNLKEAKALLDELHA
jgi:hypothetical protein